MKIQAPKRILSDDFSEDDKELASKIGGILNTYLEELYALSSGNITISDNLNEEIKTVTVAVNSDGIPKSNVSFKNNLKGKVHGLSVIRTFGNTSPTAAPFIEFVEVSGILKVSKVIGLVADKEYQLVIRITAG